MLQTVSHAKVPQRGLLNIRSTSKHGFIILPGFSAYRGNREYSKGVIIYVKEDIQSEQSEIPGDMLECVGVNITLLILLLKCPSL